jgi:SCY1-like protein 1
VLKFIEVVETDNTIHIVTERVTPLAGALHAQATKTAREREDWLLWGLHRISVVYSSRRDRGACLCCLMQVALAFVNDPAASTHGNVCINSIFISPSGEWKLGGLELLSSPQDEAAVLYVRD